MYSNNEKLEYYGYVGRMLYEQHMVYGRPGSKRHRTALYQVPSDDRCGLSVFVGNRRVTRQSQNPIIFLKYSSIPYWMSGNAYKDMLSRLGVEF